MMGSLDLRLWLYVGYCTFHYSDSLTCRVGTSDGAGVRILERSFWANSLRRQQHSWVIMPIGRTSWVAI
jgi:hypothetical protein